MKYISSGLTYQQENDCYRVGRSPRSGKHFPTGTPTPLQISAREMNWRKLVVKGAVGSLQHIATLVGVNVNDLLEVLEQKLLEASENKHNAAKLFEQARK